MSESVPLLLATDLPFWRRRTGAEQRIFSLARFAHTSPFRLVVWYVGLEQPPPVTNEGPVVMWLHGGGSGWWPFRKLPPVAKVDSAAAPHQERTLADYRWPTALGPFRRVVRRVQPAWIICEYVTMAYLAAELRARPIRGIRPPGLCLDTHDILHRRCERFAAAGHRHWLTLSAAEEAAALQPFDLILAIQAEEATWFRAQHPTAEVLVAGHALDFGEIAGVPAPPAGPLRIGYIGSRNGSNVDAVRWFAKEVWPRVRVLCPAARWLIAGTILDDPAVAELTQHAQIDGQRDLAALTEFYGAVNVVVNPVRFGTGLKIKTVEALAYGRTVVTTPDGAVGVPEQLGASCWVAETPGAMAERLAVLGHDLALRSALSTQAEQVARQVYSDSVVYRELSRRLTAKL